MSGTMSGAPGIGALLIALKQREADKSNLDGMEGGDDQGADQGHDPNDDPNGSPDDDTSPEENKQNAEIVDVLQSTYPKIYAKITAQLQQPDDSDQGPPDASQQSNAPISGMM
jgi:hypothetical protein